MLCAMPNSIRPRNNSSKLTYIKMPIGCRAVYLCTDPGGTERGDQSDSCNFAALPAVQFDAHSLAVAPTGTKAERRH